MQILRNQDTGLLFSPFAIGGVWRLQTCVLHCFSLDDPDRPLPEEELWTQCMAELGEGGALDPGFPKPRGEVLVCGAWHAPGGVPAEGGVVRIECGPVSRSLAVFGPRLRQVPAGPVTRPAPVTRVPLTWAMTWGGPAHPENRTGVDASRESLPQVEQPSSGGSQPQVRDLSAGPSGSPVSWPDAACPLPVPADAPARLALAGTYDGHWLEAFWPGFPADVSPEFFMLAQKEQRLDESYGAGRGPGQAGFFLGGEPFRLEGLHPSRPVIAGRLPRLKVRVFATRTDAPAPVGAPGGSPAETAFEEGRAHLETVWFFPSIERGVALYRTVFATRDEEMSDIVRLFAVVEDAAAPDTDAAFWLEEQRRRAARPAPPSFAFPPEAKSRLEAARASVRTLEEDLHRGLDRACGQAPVLPVPSEKLTDLARRRIDRALAHIDRARESMKDMRARFGHAVRLDASFLDRMRERVVGLGPEMDRIDRGMGSLRRMLARTDTLAARGRTQVGRFTQGVPLDEDQSRILQGALNRFDEAAGGVPRDLWSDAALRLLACCSLPLDDAEGGDGCRRRLAAAGLPGNVGANALLGLLTQDLAVSPDDWGLNRGELPAGALDDSGKFVLPAGLVLPWFEGSRCRALHVRPLRGESDILSPDGDWVMPGSSPGAQAIGAIRAKPVLLTCDPLAAWLMYAEAGDVFAIVLATEPGAPLTGACASALKDAPGIFWPAPPLDPDRHPDGLPPAGGRWTPDRTGTRAAELAARWSGLEPAAADALTVTAWPADHATAHLAGAKASGLDVRAWLVSLAAGLGLPVPDEPPLDPAHIEACLPRPDLAGMRARLQEHARDIIDKRKEPFKKIEQNALTATNERLQAMGLESVTLSAPTLDELIDEPLHFDPDPQVLERLDRLEAGMGDLTGEKGAEGVRRARRRYLKGMEKLREVGTQGQQVMRRVCQARAAGTLPFPVPDWVQDLPGGASCLSPAAPAPNPEDLRQGGKGLTLRQLDLSGMDLAGMQLEDSFLEDVALTGANLSGARWKKVMCTRVKLSGADLSGARLDLCSFTECGGTGVIARGLEAETCQWNRGGLDDADLDGARLRLLTCSGAAFSGVWERVGMELVLLQGGTLNMLTFRDCRMEKTSFTRNHVRSLRAEGGVWTETGFVGCDGGALTLTDVDAGNLRLLHGCRLSDVVFDHCRLDRLCMRDSVITGLVARRCSLADAVIDGCTLTCARLAGCRGPRARLVHCDLEGADLRRLSLPEGSLRRSRLVSANLEGANLCAADLHRAVLGETRLDGANLAGTIIAHGDALLRRTRMSS